MKNSILFGILILFLCGCQREKIDLYNSGGYICFSNKYIDSIAFSFKFFPGVDNYKYPLKVKLIGDPVSVNRGYRVVVDKERTTATTEQYILPENPVFRADKVEDTCFIQLIKTPDLDTRTVRLIVRLEATEDLGLGPQENTLAIMYINNNVSKPIWWTDDISRHYLGDYSDKKFTLFIEQAKVSDLTGLTRDEIRTYALIFKNYLQREKDAGRTVRENNGQEMTVNVVGH